MVLSGSSASRLSRSKYCTNALRCCAGSWRLPRGHVRRDGAVGPDFEDQTIVVGLLADAGVFRLRSGRGDGGEDRVDRNGADDLFFGGVLECRDETAALVDFEFDAGTRCRWWRVAITWSLQDGDGGVSDEIAGRRRPGPSGHGEHLGHSSPSIEMMMDLTLRMMSVTSSMTPLFGEFMIGSGDLHGDRAFSRPSREKNAVERIADGGAEAAFERFHDEPAVRGGLTDSSCSTRVAVQDRANGGVQ